MVNWRSVLDFFVVCSKVLPFVTRMVIDDQKKHFLTNYHQVGKTGKAVDSDHFTEYMDLNIEVEVEKPSRVEIFNFKEEEAQVKFKRLTSETTDFTRCFEDGTPLLKQIDHWQQVLKTYCSKSFKKIRIRKRSIKPLKQPLASLIDERNALVKLAEIPENKVKLEKISKRIFEIEAEENRNKIVNNFKQYSDIPESINLHQMWRILKRIWPKVGSQRKDCDRPQRFKKSFS